jgi:hypothetical protein
VGLEAVQVVQALPDEAVVIYLAIDGKDNGLIAAGERLSAGV